VVVGVLWTALACTSNAPEVDTSNLQLSRVVIDTNADGPAGVDAVDLDADGDLDLVVNFFGDRGPDPGPVEFPPGGVHIYWNEPGADDDGEWRKETVLDREDGVYFPNSAHARDMDADGDLDLVVAAGFFVCEFTTDIGPCGEIFWLEQGGAHWNRHVIADRSSGAFYHELHFADIDADGVEDLVTIGEFQADARAQWFPGLPDGGFAPPHEVGQGGGSIPALHDVDGDGDLDIASAEFFFEGASFAWLENVAPPSAETPAGEWQRHVISAELGRSIQLSVIEDLFGDGADGWVASNHVNNATGEPTPESGIYLLDPGADPTAPWTSTLISDGIRSRPTVGLAFQAAPGVFSWGDVDMDGDIDITASGDGDPRVFWFEQTEDGTFVQHVLAEEFGQAAGGTVADLDDDGLNEVLFTSYENNELAVFAWTVPEAQSNG